MFESKFQAVSGIHFDNIIKQKPVPKIYFRDQNQIINFSMVLKWKFVNSLA